MRYLMLMLVLVFVVCGATEHAESNVQTYLYVATTGNDTTGNGTFGAPFATIGRARQEVRLYNTNMTGDIIVYILAGTYYHTAPLAFSPLDSGTNGYYVIYRNYPGDAPIVSGGVRVTTAWSAVGGGVYKTHITDPAIQGLRFKQLHVKGVPAIRARYPDAGLYSHVRAWNRVVPPNLADSTIGVYSVDLGGATTADSQAGNEIEFVAFREYWQSSLRVEIIGNAPPNANLQIAQPERIWAFTLEPAGYPTYYCPQAQCGTGTAYFLENALVFLNSAGEFYYDIVANDLYYFPRGGETLGNDNTPVIIPSLERVVQVQGVPNNPTHHIKFLGLSFQHSRWMPVCTGCPSPYTGATTGFQTHVNEMWPGPVGAPNGESDTALMSISPAVYVKDAEYILIEQGSAKFTGGAGIGFSTGVHYSSISRNTFDYTGASAIQVNSGTPPCANNADAPACATGMGGMNTTVWKDTHHVAVNHNTITNAGYYYRSASSIDVGYTHTSTFDHNHISNGTYTGIYIGCCNRNDASAQYGRNMVRWNHIHDVMTLLTDGAGIYTAGKQPEGVWAWNYIHTLERNSNAGGNPIVGFYMDQHSQGVYAYQNVLESIVPNCPLGHPFDSFIQVDGVAHYIVHAGAISCPVPPSTGCDPPTGPAHAYCTQNLGSNNTITSANLSGGQITAIKNASGPIPAGLWMYDGTQAVQLNFPLAAVAHPPVAVSIDGAVYAPTLVTTSDGTRSKARVCTGTCPGAGVKAFQLKQP